MLQAIRNAVNELFPDKDNSFQTILTNDIAAHVIPALEVIKIKSLKPDTQQFYS